MTKRLPPLIDDPNEPPYVRELLQAGRDFRMNDYDFEQGLAKHLNAVETGAPMPDWAKALEASAGAGTKAAAGIAGSALSGWVALPLVTAAVVTAVVLGSQSEPSRPAEDPEPASVAAGPAPAAGEPAQAPAAAVEPPQSAAPEPGSAEPVTATAAKAGPSPSTPRAASASPGRAAGAERHARPPRVGGQVPSQPPKATREDADATNALRASTPAAAPSPADAPQAPRSAAAAPAVAPPANAQPEPSAKAAASEAPAAPAPQAEPRPEPQPAKAEVDDVRLEREMRMLAVAQRVLHSDTERALELARQGEREFPGSLFTQERQQILLLALVKLGRLEEARRLAKPYLARYPNGPFSDRVRRALAEGRVER